MEKQKLEKEVYALVELLMQKMDFETQPNPEQLRQDSIELANDELKEFRKNLNKLYDDSKGLILYQPLFGKMVNQLYAALDNYEVFISDDEKIKDTNLPIEKQHVIKKQQMVRNDFLKRVQDHYRRGEN